MRRWLEALSWRLRNAWKTPLIAGLVCVISSLLGEGLTVAGVKIPVVASVWFRVGAGLIGALAVVLSLLVGEKPSPRLGGVRGKVPDLPAHYLPRREMLDLLRAKLVNKTRRRRLRPCQVGLWGMAGSGKSVLAAAIARDEKVRDRFSDGVAWIRLEEHTSRTGIASTQDVFVQSEKERKEVLIRHQKELLMKLPWSNGSAEEIFSVEHGRDRLTELLRKRAFLLVVDNVWTSEDLYAFRVLDARGALLVTTRDVGIIREAGCIEVEVPALTDKQALSLAASWAGLPPSSLPEQAAEALKLVGNSPLGVTVVAGSGKNDGHRWAELAQRLKDAKLSAFRLQSPEYPYRTLLEALRASLDYLTTHDRRRYIELAVFADRDNVPRDAVEALWGPAGLTTTDVGDLLAMFADQALLRYDPTNRVVQLHDLQFDLARAVISNALPAAHQRLLDGYAAQCPTGWPSGPNDGYFYQHLLDHLAAAGRISERDELLTDPEWMRSQLAVGGVSGLLNNYTNIPRGSGLALVQEIIHLAAPILVEDADQLPSQLAGRTIGRTEPELARLHAKARTWSHTAWLEPITPSLPQPGQGLQRTLLDHDGPVQDVALSANGRVAVSSGGHRCSVVVWDLAATSKPRTLYVHRHYRIGFPVRVAISADGRTVISCDDDGVLRVWDLADAAEPRKVHEHHSPLRAVAISADGRTVISCDGDGVLRVWDLAEATEPRTLHEFVVDAIAISGDGRTAISCSWNGVLHVLDLTGTTEPRTLPVGSEGHVAISGDGCTAISCGRDGMLHVLDLTGTTEPRTLPGYSARTLAISADGRTAISGGWDGVLRVWDLCGSTSQAQHIERRVSDIGISSDGHVAISCADGKVEVWNPLNNDEPRILTEQSNSAQAVAVSADGSTALSGDDEGTLRIWNLQNNTESHTISGHNTRVVDVAISANGRTAISGCEDGEVCIWDVSDSAEPRNLCRFDASAPVDVVAMSPDGRTAISFGADQIAMMRHPKFPPGRYQYLYVWSRGCHKSREVSETHSKHYINSVHFNAHGFPVIVADDHLIQVWSRNLDKRIHQWRSPAEIDAVAISPDGKTVITGTDRSPGNSDVSIRDLTTGQEIARAFTDDEGVNAIAASATTILVTDRTGRLHTLRLRLPKHQSP